MLPDLLRRLFISRGRNAVAGMRPAAPAPLKLHIGGHIAHPDWKIFDVQPGPLVDYVGHCTDLSRFRDGSAAEIYASHVIEHLGFRTELPQALREFNRVLAADGLLRLSVPDLDVLCRLFMQPGLSTAERYKVMQMMYGGQLDDADFHRVGLSEELLRGFLQDAGFDEATRVSDLGWLTDSSRIVFKGIAISLNFSARKRAST